MSSCDRFLFPRHNFGDWSIDKEQEIEYTTYVGIKRKYYVRQKRQCRNCGYVEINVKTITK